MAIRRYLFISITASLFILAQAAPAASELAKVENRFRLSWESVDMPRPDDDMGLVGFHYLVDIGTTWYGGIGGFGSISGDRGGFLTGGLTGGLHVNLGERLVLDAGLFVGGGGGGGADQGDGLMIRPHVGLAYDFRPVRLGLAYSRVDFPETDIDSDNVSAFLDLPFTSWLSSGRHVLAATALDRFDSASAGQTGFVRQEGLVKFRSYDPEGDARAAMGLVSDERLDVVGVQFRHFLGSRPYALVETMGAFDGEADGYAEVSFGGGYRLPLAPKDRLAANINLALGSGGGGGVDMGGGGFVRAEAGLELRLSPSGYTDSLDGKFEAASLGTELGIAMETFGSGPGTRPKRDTDLLAWNRWRLRAGHQSYLDPERKAGADDSSDLHLVTVKLDRLLPKHLYVTGQAGSAYGGEGGGYAVGLIGLGLQSPMLLDKRVRVFAELLAGAAGGGGIAVGEGGTWQPLVGIDYPLNEACSVELAGGLTRAIDGELETSIIDISLTWRFSSLGRKIIAE